MSNGFILWWLHRNFKGTKWILHIAASPSSTSVEDMWHAINIGVFDNRKRNRRMRNNIHTESIAQAKC